MYVSVDFSQIKKEETKILKMIQNAKEEERLASERSYMKLYYNQFKEKRELTTKTVPNAKATELAANPMYLTICGFSFSKSVVPAPRHAV